MFCVNKNSCARKKSETLVCLLVLRLNQRRIEIISKNFVDELKFCKLIFAVKPSLSLASTMTSVRNSLTRLVEKA